jgi:hypothetical protein
MPGATELLEHMEHAGHAGHSGHGGDHGGKGGANTGRMIGITMAVLGVMLAFCAAMVGSARTELIGTMVEQSNTLNEYQAEEMKYRATVSQLQMLHALTPSQSEIRTFEDQLKGVHRNSGAADSEDTAELKAAIALSTKELAAIITPDPEDELHFIEMIHTYQEEATRSHEWAESYDELVEAHFKAAEHYEWGQLASEIGIVIASIALLLASRLVWGASLVCGIMCAGIIAWTYLDTRGHIHHGEDAIVKEKKEYEELKQEKGALGSDAKFLAEVEQGARAAIAAHGGAAPPAHGAPAGSAGGAEHAAPPPPAPPASHGAEHH